MSPTRKPARTAPQPARQFEGGIPLASGSPTEIQFTVVQAARPNQPFRPLPPPTGKPPYHLSLEQVIGSTAVQQIQAAGKLVFNVAGDTGGVKAPQSQQIVALKMAEQFQDPAQSPAFCYHLGDVVYYYGEASEYAPQFYEPYVHYAAPIMAIPGNHDGDLKPNDSVSSLAAFVENFCAATPHPTPESQDTQRDALTQPNVYWTLDAPFATIIGLYTNVPEGGQVDAQQRAWLVSELKNAPRAKALLLALHHPIYSADNFHGGSAAMLQLLNSAFRTSGRTPDIVLTGHVHNYQRFTAVRGKREVPCIVAGGGGYWNLHYVQKQPDGKPLKLPYTLPGSQVTLESYFDTRHGFLRLTITPQAVAGEYFTVPRPQESWHAAATLADSFTLNLNTHQLARRR